MKRGDFVTVVQAGDFGKPRPALIVQTDFFNEQHPTITVLLISTALVDAPLIRIDVRPNNHNGLKQACQIQIDKIMTVRREKIGNVFGYAGEDLMLSVTRSLAIFLGFA